MFIGFVEALRRGGIPASLKEHLLLLEAMEGDHTLFLRQDGIERAWAILDPVLRVPGPVVPYEPGGWGPPEADALIAPRRWHVSGLPHDA